MEDRGLGLLDATFTLLMLCVGVAAIWAFLAGATDVTGRKISSRAAAVVVTGGGAMEAKTLEMQ